jgi:hypothetical protein
VVSVEKSVAPTTQVEAADNPAGAIAKARSIALQRVLMPVTPNFIIIVLFLLFFHAIPSIYAK